MPVPHQSNVALGELDSSQFYTAEELWPYLSETDRVVLAEEVNTAINHELAHAEDLEAVIPRLLRACTTEAQELRRAIKSMASSQMLEGHRAVQIVKESGERIQDLRELFIKQGSIIAQMNVTSGSYKQLRELHYLRSNVTSVIEWVEVLNELRYTDMYRLVEQRQFAAVYKRLCRLQLIRQTVTEELHSYPKAHQNSFDPYFEKLELVQTMFVEGVYKLFRETSVPAAIQKALKDPPRVGAVVQSIPEFTQLEECVQLCAVEITEDKGFLYSADGEPLITEAKIFEAVAACAKKLWVDDVMAEFTNPVAQGVAYLDRMKKIAPILSALEMTLIPLSSRLSLFPIVVVSLHGEVVKSLEIYADPGLEAKANDLIAASDFVRWYKEMLKDGNYSSHVDIAALDKLSACMTAGAVDGLMMHLVQLCKVCARTVLEDGNKPFRSPSGLPVTTGPKDMFAVLQQTLAGLSTAIEVDVMRQIGRACAAAIESYFSECKLLIDYDRWEEMEQKQKSGGNSGNEEWKMRRLAFLYAFCNDCSVIERNMDTVELVFVSYWNEEEGLEDNSPFIQTQDVLVDHASHYIDEVILHVERMVEGQWPDVFRSKGWYEGEDSPTRIILDTMADFIDEEFSCSFEASQLHTVTHRMMQRYIQKFLTELMEFLGDAVRHPSSKAAKDWNEFVNCFVRDIVITIDMWKARISDSRGKLISKVNKALELVKNLLAVRKPVDFDFIVQKDLLDDFGDCPTFVVRFLLLSRKKEIGEDTCNSMLALWDERIAHQRRDADDKPTAGWKQMPSFFGMLDRSLADIGKKGGLFSSSPTKKRKKAEQKRQKMEKEKRKAEQEKRLADAATAVKSKSPPAPLVPRRDSVEVVTLASVLDT
ncbi:Exocyst complex component Sec6 [Trypanosoma brucei equiperdum]|uniref:Exocyst complex component Sec6 n=1 Tax=Trypanosoma brucei equiperdum TaxID=630700 RepID=A0A3L6KU97_9TRYP|nr:Exocyst complex component Sec6 [Trypanosoma brucei equiperdum]